MIHKNETGFYDLMVNRKMYSGKENLKFYLHKLFNNVELAQKNVLDVGGGSGLLTFYAGIQGARKAVCLEPELDGSRNGMTKGFHGLRKEFPDSLPVELIPLTLQEYMPKAGDEEYDVVIMHNSINHLDEEACIHLLTSEACYSAYVNIFKNVHRIMKKGGMLVITDCARNNFFNDIGVKNVFVPSIEWHKHQQPGTWIAVLQEAGFTHPSISWLTPNRLRGAGSVVMGNYFMSYLTRSFFKVTIQK